MTWLFIGMVQGDSHDTVRTWFNQDLKVVCDCNVAIHRLGFQTMFENLSKCGRFGHLHASLVVLGGKFHFCKQIIILFCHTGSCFSVFSYFICSLLESWDSIWPGSRLIFFIFQLFDGVVDVLYNLCNEVISRNFRKSSKVTKILNQNWKKLNKTWMFWKIFGKWEEYFKKILWSWWYLKNCYRIILK